MKLLNTNKKIYQFNHIFQTFYMKNERKQNKDGMKK